jgi:hypothetical protein
VIGGLYSYIEKRLPKIGIPGGPEKVKVQILFS